MVENTFEGFAYSPQRKGPSSIQVVNFVMFFGRKKFDVQMSEHPLLREAIRTLR